MGYLCQTPAPCHGLGHITEEEAKRWKSKNEGEVCDMRPSRHDLAIELIISQHLGSPAEDPNKIQLVESSTMGQFLSRPVLSEALLAADSC